MYEGVFSLFSAIINSFLLNLLKGNNKVSRLNTSILHKNSSNVTDHNYFHQLIRKSENVGRTTRTGFSTIAPK